jgi:hypothetical protein
MLYNMFVYNSFEEGYEAVYGYCDPLRELMKRGDALKAVAAEAAKLPQAEEEYDESVTPPEITEEQREALNRAMYLSVFYGKLSGGE